MLRLLTQHTDISVLKSEIHLKRVRLLKLLMITQFDRKTSYRGKSFLNKALCKTASYLSTVDAVEIILLTSD